MLSQLLHWILSTLPGALFQTLSVIYCKLCSLCENELWFFFKGLGAFAVRAIARLSCFGPYGGTQRNASLVHEASNYAWQVGNEAV